MGTIRQTGNTRLGMTMDPTTITNRNAEHSQVECSALSRGLIFSLGIMANVAAIAVIATPDRCGITSWPWAVLGLG